MAFFNISPLYLVQLIVIVPMGLFIEVKQVRQHNRGSRKEGNMRN